MSIKLSDNFTYRKLLHFTLPSIAMMIITSIYSMVDGLFVSNLVGGDAFAAVNLIMPFVMIFSSVSFMLSTGGSALVAKFIGEGNKGKANEVFSMLIYVIIGFSVFSTIVGIVFIEPIAIMLGATPVLLDYSVSYGRILLLGLPFFMLQTTFQVFFIVAEKPNMGFLLSIVSGLTNVALDFLFIYFFRWGVVGAAAATGLSQFVGGAIPLVYFLKNNNSILRITKTKWDWKALLKSSINGSSEMMTNVSMSLVSMLYNFQLIKLAGENGVAAYGVIMYVGFIFVSIFIGFSIASAPIISYNYGARKHSELKNIFKKSVNLILFFSLLLTLMSELLAVPLSKIFVGYDAQLLTITVRAFRIFAISFLFSGINMFASSFFTALNNGIISALISFLRTLVFQVIMILLLPKIWGVDGVWLAVVVAEILTLFVSVFFFITANKHYHYL